MQRRPNLATWMASAALAALGFASANCGDSTASPDGADRDASDDRTVVPNDGAVNDDGGTKDSGDEDSGDSGDSGDGGDAKFDCPGEEGMRRIPAGGSVAEFCIDRTAVTMAAYQKCVDDDDCEPPLANDNRCNKHFAGRDSHPVDCVTYAQADTFCKAQGKRLPTLAERTWAARGAVENAKYPWGSTDPTATDNPHRLCWVPNSDDKTCAVGSFPKGASPQGVLDLSGNVWEWTSTSEGDDDRMVTGGAYWDRASDVHLFQAGYAEPTPAAGGSPAYGFRCVK